MRPIKFRAYGPNCKHMWEWDEIKHIDLLSLTTIGEKILMQFTGLTDIHGKEIYTDDIVHWGHVEGWEECRPRKAIVHIDPDLFFRTINLEHNHDFHFGNFMYKNTHQAMEVIGNIHQSPELLKD